VLTGIAEPDCNMHALNESVTLEQYQKGIKYAQPFCGSMVLESEVL